MSDAGGVGGSLADAGFGTGSLIAGYRLEEPIGRGGMAVVFRARDERLQRLVALKVLAPALAGDEEFRQRFIRESQTAAAVDDPHIIPVFEAGEAAGVLFLAMRYVPGGDLRSLLQRTGPFAAARTAGFISAVASALDAAHAAGLVHRDVKPANMLVDARPGRPVHVYLSDFGLTKGALAASARLTATGQFMGTLEYVSPEQIAGKLVDGRTDQYALACSAFELLTGAPPFQADETAAVLYAQLSQPPPALTSRRPDLPAAADQVLARALAKAPGDRYPSCRDFADALRVAFGLAPYDTGPEVYDVGPEASPAVSGPDRDPPAAEHAATRLAAPSGRIADAPTGEAPTGEAPTGEAPTGEAPVPRGPAGPGPAGPPPARPPGDGSGTRPARRRRQRVLVSLAAAAVLVAAGSISAVLLSSRPHPLGRFPLTAASGNTVVSGDVSVEYHDGQFASAQLSARIKDVTSGEVAELFAQPFPFTRAPARDGSVILQPHKRTARYTFTVTPSVATQYKVELFPDSTATAPVATSPARTIYVWPRQVFSPGRSCSQPVCHQTTVIREYLPASALRTEIAKRWYFYLGVATSPGSNTPPAPRSWQLNAGNPQISTSQRVSGTEFQLTISYSFQVGNNSYNWDAFACLQDTEAKDGIGLPGHHECGDPSVLATVNYLG